MDVLARERKRQKFPLMQTDAVRIGTADIKDLYVKNGRGTKPLLEVLSDLVKRGVEIRLIHAKEPGPAFRQDFNKYPALIDGMERVLCPPRSFQNHCF